MPDWSYRTIFQPVFFRLPAKTGRAIALGVMGNLGRRWLGRQIIEFMGHFRLDPSLEIEYDDVCFASPVGLGCRLDPELRAQEALSQFGIGVIELGPVTGNPQESCTLKVDSVKESITISPDEECVPLNRARSRLKRGLGVPILIRVSCDDSSAVDVIRDLAEFAAGFILVGEPTEELVRLLRQHETRLLLHVTTETLPQLSTFSRQFSPAGYCVEGQIPSDGNQLVLGKAACQATQYLVSELRVQVGDDPLVIATGGIHEPQDALQVFDRGADLVLVDTGLTFSGPGLPKRINELWLSSEKRDSPTSEKVKYRPAEMSWFWTLLLGIGLFGGGVLAFLIASTRIVLPYDEAHSGLTRADLLAINDKLLDFMQHDRITLAGTMLGLGIIYIALSWFGSRNGHHWAYKSIVVSAFVGFFSFFLFLGFGYFDPFHAFVTAIMFQFLAMSMHGHISPVKLRTLPELTNDADWQRSLWGQLMMVIHGVTLIIAGITISSFGITSVFIADDLKFMQTTYAEICAPHPMLLPLVAHDRATFGGMTLSTGLAVLMAGLWGFRRGNRWLWRALMSGGTLCYLLTLWIHWKVGYTSVLHLIPVYLGLAMLWTSGCLSYRHLCTVEYFGEKPRKL